MKTQNLRTNSLSYLNLKMLQLFTGKNLGYGGGNNYGLKVETDYAFILNPDSFLINISLIT